VADQDFVNFENAMRELKLSEDQLKRLVSEGEIRAIRGDNNTMKFRKEEIERLKQDTGKTIRYTEESSDTLTDDLLFDEADELDVGDEGMATAQISSEDTFVGDDTGMTTTPLTPATPVRVAKGGPKGKPAPKATPKPAKAARTPTGGARQSTTTVRRTTGRSTRIRQTALEEKASGIGMGVTALLVVTFIVSAYGLLLWKDIAKNSITGPTRGIADWAGENFAAKAPGGTGG
jgi:hypothetical protein